MHVLEVAGLTKHFGDVQANASIDLLVRPGEVVGLLGHNGAGKTTLISQVVGLLRPDAGSIHVAGIDAVAHPARARRGVALQSQGQAPLDGLTPRLAIELSGRVRGLSRSQARDRAERLADELDIGPWLDRRARPDGRGVSGGVRRLTGFAMAVAAPTPLVVLDEPTNDIDAGRRRGLWDGVRRLADEGAGVLLVTHNVTEAERVVDELVVLDDGRVLAAGTPGQLRGAAETDLCLELQLRLDAPDPSEHAMPVHVHRRVHVGRRVRLTVSADEAAPTVAWAAAQRRAERIEGYALAPATLEDAYLALTGSGITPSHDPDTKGPTHVRHP